jgi:hypothetical protein
MIMILNFGLQLDCRPKFSKECSESAFVVNNLRLLYDYFMTEF